MLKLSALIVALFAMFSTSVLAQDLRVCPNVQVGVLVGGPAIYSDLQRFTAIAPFSQPVAVPNSTYI